MSLSSATLSAIQQAGAAAYAADAELKSAVKDYAVRVNAAMSANPYGLGNDTLFENWKVVARLSQTLSGIEQELKKVHHVASELIADDQPRVHEIPALAAPAESVAMVPGHHLDLATTDVVAKRRKTTGSYETRARKLRVGSLSANRIDAASSRAELGGNPAKLLRHLKTVLHPKGFTAINQTVIGHATGIPLGSMTAAIKKLVNRGHITTGPSGGFKLTKREGSK